MRRCAPPSLSGFLLFLAVLPQTAVLSGSSSDGTAGAVLGREAEEASLVIPEPSGTACSVILDAALRDSPLSPWVLMLARPGDTLSISLAELAASPFCVEGPGGFTTTTGNAITGTWAGISLPDLLLQWAGLEDDHSLTFAADDGYRMAFSGREILDRSQGTWILAMLRDGTPMPAAMGLVRAIKVGPSTPMVDGHLSVQRLSRISITGVPAQPYAIAMRGRMQIDVDRQTLQSCASCHGARVRVASGTDSSEYWGVPVFRLLAFSDDSLYAPHRQDSAIRSYRQDLAISGYSLEVGDADGRRVRLDSRDLDGEDGVILALYRDGLDLEDDATPALLVVPKEEGAQPDSATILPKVRTMTLDLP
ncbi:hypothetical protein JXA88_06280 [Candidatus Fermentibacteria bacterium]|nr:hypothetical protein [Candidatus Fermentibacteria bacterium]